MERIAEDADLAGQLRDHLQDKGQLSAHVITGKENKGQKFRDYFEHNESLKRMPSHRLLAVLRGRNEGVLRLHIDVDHQDNNRHPCESMIARQQNIPLNKQQARTSWLSTLVQQSWKIKLQPRLETDLLSELRQRAEQEAIEVFAAISKTYY